MDLSTLKRLKTKDDPLIYTGLGNKKYLAKHGIKNVEEMDWWDTKKNTNTEITFVPAQHFSARGVTDRNKTLW
jgi:L-ascorbate metabolism protein UlaG (beta-lactamase superfamily)